MGLQLLGLVLVLLFPQTVTWMVGLSQASEIQAARTVASRARWVAVAATGAGPRTAGRRVQVTGRPMPRFAQAAAHLLEHR